MKRKSYGLRIIGKPFQFDGDQYAVIKTQKGYYARMRGKNWLKIGDKHRTAKQARKELMDIYKVAKKAKGKKQYGKSKR